MKDTATPQDPERVALVAAARDLDIPIQSATAWKLWQVARLRVQTKDAKPEEVKGNE